MTEFDKDTYQTPKYLCRWIVKRVFEPFVDGLVTRQMLLDKIKALGGY